MDYVLSLSTNAITTTNQAASSRIKREDGSFGFSFFTSTFIPQYNEYINRLFYRLKLK